MDSYNRDYEDVEKVTTVKKTVKTTPIDTSYTEGYDYSTTGRVEDSPAERFDNLVEGAKELGQKGVSKIKDAAKAVGETTANIAHNAKEGIKDAAANVADKTSNLAYNAKEGVKNAASNVAENTSNLAYNAKEGVKNAASNLAENTSHLAYQAKEGVKEGASKTAELSRNAVSSVAGAASTVAHKTGDAAYRCKEGIKDAANTVADKTHNVTHDNKYTFNNAGNECHGEQCDRAANVGDQAKVFHLKETKAKVVKREVPKGETSTHNHEGGDIIHDTVDAVKNLASKFVRTTSGAIENIKETFTHRSHPEPEVVKQNVTKTHYLNAHPGRIDQVHMSKQEIPVHSKVMSPKEFSMKYPGFMSQPQPTCRIPGMVTPRMPVDKSSRTVHAKYSPQMRDQRCVDCPRRGECTIKNEQVCNAKNSVCYAKDCDKRQECCNAAANCNRVVCDAKKDSVCNARSEAMPYMNNSKACMTTNSCDKKQECCQATPSHQKVLCTDKLQNVCRARASEMPHVSEAKISVPLNECAKKVECFDKLEKDCYAKAHDLEKTTAVEVGRVKALEKFRDECNARARTAKSAEEAINNKIDNLDDTKKYAKERISDLEKAKKECCAKASEAKKEFQSCQDSVASVCKEQQRLLKETEEMQKRERECYAKVRELGAKAYGEGERARQMEKIHQECQARAQQLDAAKHQAKVQQEELENAKQRLAEAEKEAHLQGKAYAEKVDKVSDVLDSTVDRAQELQKQQEKCCARAEALGTVKQNTAIAHAKAAAAGVAAAAASELNVPKVEHPSSPVHIPRAEVVEKVQAEVHSTPVTFHKQTVVLKSKPMIHFKEEPVTHARAVHASTTPVIQRHDSFLDEKRRTDCHFAERTQFAREAAAKAKEFHYTPSPPAQPNSNGVYQYEERSYKPRGHGTGYRH